MKRFLNFEFYISFIEKSLALYLTLVLAVAGLFGYVYLSHMRMLNFYERGQALNRLSVSALSLSQENFHTQLEVYEVVSLPDKKRINDFYAHERDFLLILEHTYEIFSENRDDVSPEIMSKLKSLKESAPRIQEHWHKIINAAKENKPMAEKIELLIGAEDAFDGEGFNETIKEIVGIHLKEAEENDKKIYALVVRSRYSVAIGIMVAFLLSLVMMVLYRAALKGRSHQLQLVQAGKLASLGQLSAGMAHELNSPLMFIKGFNNRIASTLKKENVESHSPVWDYISEVDSGVDRITKIIKHFKDFARLSTNELKPVSLNDLITRSFILFEEQLRLAGIEVRLDLELKKSLVLADANRIEQVLMNLISNARDALQETKRTENKFILVKSSTVDKNFVIDFSDNGNGIEKQNLSRIFDPFFTTKEVGVGTGLGLSISSGIIRDHNGTIEVQSKVGEGTHFLIKLPVASL